MKILKTVKKVVLALLLFVPALLFIPIAFDISLFHGTKWFINYLNFAETISIITYSLILILWIYCLFVQKKNNFSKINFRNNYLILIIIPLVLFGLYGIYTEWNIDIFWILFLWIYSVAGGDLANIFWLEWFTLFVSWLGWLITLFIKYVYVYLILNIYKFTESYKYYIISILISCISAITWIIILNTFIYAT